MSDFIISLLAPIILFVWVVNFAIHWFGIQKVPRLPIANEDFRDGPLISVVIAAKNEEKAIGKTIESIMNQQGARIELIVVNDRSTDRTGEIAEQIAANDASIQVVHIRELPDGWLGKNHALQTGFERAKGDYILFTDADVRFEQDAVRSATSYMIQHRIDHLTLAPRMKAKGFWLRGFVHYFLFSLSMVKWPWLPNDDRQRKHGYGIGAFNMLTRQAYVQIDMHESIAMRPDDDLQLGAKIKQAGLKQRFLTANDQLQVEWYPSLKAATVGLEKNMFAGLRYSILLLVGATFGKLIFYFFPFIAILIGDGIVWWTYLVICVLILLLYVRYTVQMSGEFPLEMIAFPFFVLLFLYITIRSCALILKRGGMDWRGTFYTLEQLKKANKNKR